MITFEEAVKTARETRNNINYFVEYKDLYVFGLKENLVGVDDETELGETTIGGWDMPFIILKSTGNVMGYSAMAVRSPEKLNQKNFIKEGDI